MERREKNKGQKSIVI